MCPLMINVGGAVITSIPCKLCIAFESSFISRAMRKLFYTYGKERMRTFLTEKVFWNWYHTKKSEGIPKYTTFKKHQTETYIMHAELTLNVTPLTVLLTTLLVLLSAL